MREKFVAVGEKQAHAIPGVGGYEWHVADDRLVWSPELVALYGLTAPPAGERGFIDLVHPDDRTRVEAETSAFLDAGDTYAHEFRIVRPDETVRVIHDRGSIERAPDQTARVMRGLNIDVTDQRPGAANGGASWRSEERLRLACEAAGCGVYDLDIAGGRAFWSPEVLALIGRPEPGGGGSVAGALDCVHPDDRARVQAEMEAATRRVGRYVLDYRIERPDGTVRWVQDRGETFGPLGPGGRARRGTGILLDLTARRQAEESLRFSEARALAVQQNAGFGVWERDLETGALDLDEMARALYDLPPEGPLDVAAVAARVHPGDRERTEALVARALEERRPIRGEHRVVLPDGRIRWISVRGHPAADAAGGSARRRAVGVLFDITERKEAEEALAEATALLEALFESAPVGLGVWDSDFRFLRVNAALAEMNGVPPAAHIGRRPDEIVPDLGGLDALYDRWRGMLESGEPWLDVDISGETPAAPGQLRHWREHFFPMRVDGTGVGIAAIVEETTARRAAEEALVASERRLRLILDSTVCFVGVLDPDGTLREANAPALAAAGVPREEVIGRKFWDTYWWNYDPAVAERLQQAVARARAGETVRYDAVVRMRGDSRMTLDFMVSPIRDNAGVVTHLVPSALDITDRKQAADRVQMLMREVNHRSKNLLALVQAVARQTVRSSGDDFLVNFERRIQALSAAQDLLVNRDWQAVGLDELVRSQLGHFDNLIGNRIRLDGPPVELTAPAAQALGMALHELATNAGKYGALSGEDGAVEIGWTVAAAGNGRRRLRMAWTERGGPPVTPPERRGFGTSVMDTMIRATLDAEVAIDYAPGGLVWRMDTGQGFADGDTGGAPVDLPGRRGGRMPRRVLVVEDESLLALELVTLLEDAGYTALGPAASVERALEVLATERPDAALLDVNLGGETAEPVAERLRAAGVPFLTVSGYAPAQQPAAFRDGPLIGKPVDSRRLLAELDRLTAGV